MKYSLSVFKGARDNDPKRLTLTWDHLATLLTTHEFVAPDQKLHCDAWSPALYPPDTRRADENVLTLETWAGDYDGVPFEAFELVLKCVAEQGWACIVHSSWRQAVDPTRFRIVLPLSRPVTRDEWPALWDALNDATGGYADQHCTTLSHIYFGPYAPLGDEEEAFSNVLEGSPVDVDKLLGRKKPPPSVPEENTDGEVKKTTPSKETVSREQLERYAKTLGRKHSDRDQELGAALTHVIRGTPFAEPGNVDNTIFRLSCTLASRWPEADPKALAEHFATSLQLMAQLAPDYEMTPAQVAYKLRRAQQAIHEEQRADETETEEAQRAQIRDAFGDGRETPYTTDEIETLPRHRWVIQYGRAYYTRILDTYRGPYVTDEALSAIVRDLSPARTAGVELYTTTPKGETTPKTLGTIVRSYGFVARDVAVDISAQASRYDEESRTLIEAPCPLRAIQPIYYPEVARWLAVLAQDRLPELLAWLSAVTLLDRPCTALFLTGPRSTGKTLLPEGTSKLWSATGNPTTLADVLGTNFNEEQLHCPLVFSDESLPTDFRGRPLTAELRQYIQARRRQLRRKFLPNTNMVGAVRLVISANNEEILATDENLSNQDIGAIVDRYLHVPCSEEAQHYLQDVDTSDWVDRNVIAQHVLWLRDNHVWKPNGRFLVHGDDTALHSRLISSTGIRSALLQFCVGYLLSPEPMDHSTNGSLMVRVHRGKLLVNVRGMIACWDLYVSNERCPTTGILGRAVAAVSEDRRIQMRAKKYQEKVNYRVIKKEHLVAWALDKGFATVEQIEQALEKSTEERDKRLAAN